LVIDPVQLENYNAFLKEEIDASVKNEPGVLTLYAVAEKSKPTQITILEVYASDEKKADLMPTFFKMYFI
jgi:4-carboxymuconolactone decarboxylase